jgi:predicted nucleotidyltransferase
VPENVRQTLDEVVAGARKTFGDALRSIVLYGSAAEGRLRATSDVNLLFVLSRFDAERANAFRDLYRFAHSAVHLNAMRVLEKELPGRSESRSSRSGQ